MLKGIEKIYKTHKNFWSKPNLVSLAYGALLFTVALIIQHFAYNYIDKHAYAPVEDLLLSNLPTIDLDIFIIQGALAFTFIVLFLFVIKPEYLLFSIKALALFLIIRSFFISLTHLGVNLHQLTLDTESIGFGLYDFLYNAKNDFFFSGHVGASFLFGMIFWKERLWRNLFFAAGLSLLCTGMTTPRDPIGEKAFYKILLY